MRNWKRKISRVTKWTEKWREKIEKESWSKWSEELEREGGARKLRKKVE